MSLVNNLHPKSLSIIPPANVKTLILKLSVGNQTVLSQFVCVCLCSPVNMNVATLLRTMKLLGFLVLSFIKQHLIVILHSQQIIYCRLYAFSIYTWLSCKAAEPILAFIDTLQVSVLSQPWTDYPISLTRHGLTRTKVHSLAKWIVVMSVNF